MMTMMPKMMQRMMEHCLTSMSKEEREKMFAFCQSMLRELEDKFPKQ